MSTYNPMLDTCYGCYEPLEDGDSIIGFYEHYIHAKCAPVHLLEVKDQFTWRKLDASQDND